MNKKIFYLICYLTFFSLSFVNGAIDYIINARSFFFAFCFFSSIGLIIVNIVLKLNNSKFVLALIFNVLFLSCVKEGSNVIVYFNFDFLNKYMYLFYTIFLFLSKKNYHKKDILCYLGLLTISGINIFIPSFIASIVYFIGYFIILVINKEFTSFSFLNLLNCLFTIIDCKYSLFGYHFLYEALLFLNAYKVVYLEYKNLNIKQNETIKYNQEILRLKEETLKTQMRPHFLFNSLTMIDVLYMKDHQKGDNALLQLNNLMRKSNEIFKEKAVEFSKELDIINDYVLLMNEKEEHKFAIDYDLKVNDFYIPPLSIEPIIENSIKYSNVNKKQDGYIRLSTSEENQIITIVIEDNGQGFDINNIKNTSIGLKNLIERFSLLDNGEVNLSSKENEYTKIIIKFRRYVPN